MFSSLHYSVQLFFFVLCSTIFNQIMNTFRYYIYKSILDRFVVFFCVCVFAWCIVLFQTTCLFECECVFNCFYISNNKISKCILKLKFTVEIQEDWQVHFRIYISINPDDKWQFLARIQSLTHIPTLNWCHTVAYLNANEGPIYCTNVDFPTPIICWLCVESVDVN